MDKMKDTNLLYIFNNKGEKMYSSFDCTYFRNASSAILRTSFL